MCRTPIACRKQPIGNVAEDPSIAENPRQPSKWQPLTSCLVGLQGSWRPKLAATSITTKNKNDWQPKGCHGSLQATSRTANHTRPIVWTANNTQTHRHKRFLQVSSFSLIPTTIPPTTVFLCLLLLLQEFPKLRIQIRKGFCGLQQPT